MSDGRVTPEALVFKASARNLDLIALTDDIYQHLVYEGEHIPLATLPGMRGRTVAIDSISKTYSVTGWRVGWVIAASDLFRQRDFRPSRRVPEQAATYIGLFASMVELNDWLARRRARNK